MIGYISQRPVFLQLLNHSLPRRESVHTGIRARRRAHFAVIRHDIDFRQLVPLANLKVVGIMRRRNFHRAGSKLAVHHLVGNDGYLAVHQRQQRLLANQLLVSFVFRMHGHSRVAKHGFRPRSRHHEKFLATHDRIFDMPEVALPFFVHHFQVAQDRQTVRAPIHQSCFAVNQTFFVKPNENFPDSPRHLRG